MKQRTAGRKFGFQFFYNKVFNNDVVEINKTDLVHDIQFFQKSLKLPTDQEEFVSELILKASVNYQEILSLIEEHLQNWRIDRVDSITKTLLVLAIVEMNFLEDPTPGKVVINEYIELAKEFGNKDSKSFINGVLDRVLNAS